jgi:hypothetical protein
MEPTINVFKISIHYCRCLGVHEISQMYAKGQNKIKYTEKIVISTLTVYCSYNYHKVASN